MALVVGVVDVAKVAVVADVANAVIANVVAVTWPAGRPALLLLI